MACLSVHTISEEDKQHLMRPGYNKNINDVIFNVNYNGEGKEMRWSSD